ncbi:hypothetical protein M378DRAFT_159965 [Amanita muscaria Koide BX008]|uniref:Uncharacterized protein n=1 Tax=Amanita muscaria (strain Koide BX008) TaxID=946122 RepID=A0A0C2XCC5_AMAMK|nr:hypothetical protein M378DRAFT_159965 [Amanita muscaria Koide BX008]
MVESDFCPFVQVDARLSSTVINTSIPLGISKRSEKSRSKSSTADSSGSVGSIAKQAEFEVRIASSAARAVRNS